MRNRTMKEAPHVLVVTHGRNQAAAEQMREALSRQTWARTELLFVGEPVAAGPGASFAFCSRDQLARRLRDPGFDYVFFWPENLPLKAAAIEKLVLSLHLVPDHLAVADHSRGIDGPWLARPFPRLAALALDWLDSSRCWTSGPAFVAQSCFHIDESLAEPAISPATAATAFPALTHRFSNLEPVSEEPLWDVPAGAPDPESILILIAAVPIGGASKFILDLAGQLTDRGKRVTIATTLYDSVNQNHWLEELERRSDGVFALSYTPQAELPRLAVHLARTRRCGRVVLTHSMTASRLLPWLRAQLPGVTFVDYTHIEFEAEWPHGGYAQRSVNQRALLDLSLASSSHLRDWMIARGAESDQVRVCHTNIDTERWKPDAAARARTRAELGLDDTIPLILYPCRIVAQKRPALFCRIIDTLRRATVTPFMVVVAGQGDQLAELEAFALQNLPDCVRVLGPVTLDRVAQLHNAADIFLLPSLAEGISLALFESMALESVPVVSDVGGQRELVTPECGHIIPVTDPSQELPQYVTALKALVENPALRRRMGTAARVRVQDHFPLDAMADKFLAALEEADCRRANRPTQLPETAQLRDLAADAMDAVRLERQGTMVRNEANRLGEQLVMRDTLIAKLKRQVAELRAEIKNAEAFTSV